jgi:hypothetical protein
MTLAPVAEYPNYVSSTPTSCQMKRPGRLRLLVLRKEARAGSIRPSLLPFGASLASI